MQPQDLFLALIYYLTEMNAALWYLTAAVGGALPASILAHAFLTRKR